MLAFTMGRSYMDLLQVFRGQITKVLFINHQITRQLKSVLRHSSKQCLPRFPTSPGVKFCELTCLTSQVQPENDILTAVFNCLTHPFNTSQGYDRLITPSCSSSSKNRFFVRYSPTL